MCDVRVGYSFFFYFSSIRLFRAEYPVSLNLTMYLYWREIIVIRVVKPYSPGYPQREIIVIRSSSPASGAIIVIRASISAWPDRI
jgi:hypothetical protein